MQIFFFEVELYDEKNVCINRWIRKIWCWDIYSFSWRSDKSRGVLQRDSYVKTVGTYTEMHKGDEEKIKAAYKQELERELNEDELETITYFVNGYEMNNQ